MRLGRKLAEGIAVEPVVDDVSEPRPQHTREPADARVVDVPPEMIDEPATPVDAH